MTAVVEHQSDSPTSSKDETKEINNNSKSNKKFSKEEIDTMSREEQELNFLNGLISLNKNFFNPSVSRMPKYLTSRFYDVNDPLVRNKENLKHIVCFENVLKRCQKMGEESGYRELPKGSVVRLMSIYLHRIHKVNVEHFASTLSLCSIWPNKKKAKSSIKHRNKDKGKIYSSLGVVYRNDPKVRLVVQESKGYFGYSPDIFKAHATVLFPPIEKHEIWTIGFVQGITKGKMEVNYNEGLRFV